MTQPTANSQEPTADTTQQTSQQPTANSQEPAKSAFITDGKLPQQTSQPRAKSQQPTASNQPTANSQQPAKSVFLTDGKLPQQTSQPRANGKQPPAPTGQVTAPPKNFTDHLANNSDRLQRASKAGTLPYFVRDNYKVGKDGTLTPTFASKAPQAIKGKKDFVIESPLGKLRSDPTGIGTLADCASYLIENRNLKKREQAFYSMLRSEIHKTDKGGAIIMQGAKPTKTEIQTANKLVQAKNGYNTIFLSPHQISKLKKMLGIKNKTNADVLLVDRKSYVARLADLKTIGSASRETIKAHLMKGSEQAPVVVLDIQGQVKRFDLIKGIRDGWCKDTKAVLLNYKGQWYELDIDKVFSDWIKKNIR